jgi:hypothetical protein
VTDEQTIWIAPRATAFTAICDQCLADDHSFEDFLSARVSGVLRLEARHGSAICGRGHQIRVERADSRLSGVIR